MEKTESLWKLNCPVAAISAATIITVFFLGEAVLPDSLTFSIIGWITWLTYLSIGITILIFGKRWEVKILLPFTALIGLALIVAAVAASWGHIPRIFFGAQSIIAGLYLIACAIFGWMVSRPEPKENIHGWHPRC
jgi:hypothetical protein